MLAASSATAQIPLRGLAYDSLHGRPLFGAFIGIAGMNVTAISDSAGRFVLPSVPRGTHRVVMQHDVLDAIGLSAAGARAVVNNEGDSVIVAVPSFATLWRAACGRDAPASADSGFLFGTVLRGGRPMPGATVAASWLDLSMDSTKAVRQKQKIMEVDTDSSGNFSLCGVPTTTGLSLRANSGGSYGVWTDVPPLDTERIGRRDLTIITLSPMQFDVPKTTVFTGRVRRDSTDAPLADADVLITDLGLSATTNARGEFRINGVTPGTHMVLVRQIGFNFSEQRVEFGTEPVDRTLVMSRITTLDSVSVVATGYSKNDEAMRLFAENKKLGLGKFFTRDDLEKARDRRMIDLLGQLPGVKPEGGSGGQGWLMSSRPNRSITSGGGPSCNPPSKEDHPESVSRPQARGGRPQLPPCTDFCYPRVYLDGVDISHGEIPNINRFNPSQLEAIEYYAGAAQVPPEYNRLNKSYCGVILLHTRRGKSP
jgi:hypothetical protein